MKIKAKKEKDKNMLTDTKLDVEKEHEQSWEVGLPR